MASDPSPAVSSESAYQDLRRLIPSLAHELDELRTSLREHNVWLQRYGFENAPTAAPAVGTITPPSDNDPELPAYSGVDVPPYTASANQAPRSRREEVEDRKNQIIEWLREGEEVLREYSARFAQLGQELGMEDEDILGTWKEGEADNALPDYERVEEREELMVGGVGEVPPPYVGSSQTVR
jgi:hypothetical protein